MNVHCTHICVRTLRVYKIQKWSHLQKHVQCDTRRSSSHPAKLSKILHQIRLVSFVRSSGDGYSFLISMPGTGLPWVEVAGTGAVGFIRRLNCIQRSTHSSTSNTRTSSTATATENSYFRRSKWSTE